LWHHSAKILKYFRSQEAILQMNRLGTAGRPFFFVVNFDMDEIFVLEEEELAASPFCFNMPERRFEQFDKAAKRPKHISAETISYADYLKAFEKVQSALKAGNTYLLNLTFPSILHCDSDLPGIYQHAVAPFKLLFKDRFVVFSPERFVRMEKERVFTYPMKGTIDAGIDNAAQLILDDEKEVAEHRTIVDLLRNDLGIAGHEVRVDRFRYLSEINTHKGKLLQVSSEISSAIGSEWHAQIGTILFSMLPAGSVTGAPKKKTVSLIKEAEGYDRGYYTGIFGFYDGKVLDSAVMIRFIEQDSDSRLIYKSGGGITCRSDPEKEYQELIDKIYVPLS
jgi:para-aminobenzoate synthetase component 1